MLRPMLIEPVPHEMVRVARATLPKGHRYLRRADELAAPFIGSERCWITRHH
jgi:hypothetical protein